MQFSKITKEEAPTAPARRARPQAEAAKKQYDDFVHQIVALPEDEVGKLTPSKDETIRQVSSRLYRAAKRTDTSIKVWSDDKHVFATKA